MKENFETLKRMVEEGGTCVNLGRHMAVKHPILYEWCLSQTEFLNTKTKIKDTERFYCILRRSTHLANIDEFGRNGYSQLASKEIIKGNLTKAEKGLILDPTLRNEFYRYKSIVTYVTEKSRSSLSEGYVTGLAGVPGAYHIDHMYSVINGYRNKISPLIIGNKANLEMIPWKENLRKHGSCSINIEKLLGDLNYTLEQSEKEYSYFISLIKKDIQDRKPVSGAALMGRYYESELYR